MRPQQLFVTPACWAESAPWHSRVLILKDRLEKGYVDEILGHA
jgi:hypothetical protein